MAVILSCNITKGRWTIYFLSKSSVFCLSALQGDLFNGAFICFLFPANSPDLELYPVAPVIGAVSRVICMDAV